LKKYCPTYTDDIIYLGLRELTGDGLQMALEAGAATEGLGVLHYWGARYPGPRIIGLMNRRPEMVWINKKGDAIATRLSSLIWAYVVTLWTGNRAKFLTPFLMSKSK